MKYMTSILIIDNPITIVQVTLNNHCQVSLAVMLSKTITNRKVKIEIIKPITIFCFQNMNISPSKNTYSYQCVSSISPMVGPENSVKIPLTSSWCA